MSSESPTNHTEEPGEARARSRPKTSSRASGAIHLVMQSKGGVGKTVVASLLAQALKEEGKQVRCLDLDSLNPSFAAISGIGAERVDLLGDDGATDVESMNACFSGLLTSDVTTVIDTGASSFAPLSEYLISTGLLELMIARGKRVIVHVPLVGGEALLEAAAAFKALVVQFPAGVEFSVWLNSFFGPVATDEGTKIEDTALFDDLRDRVSSFVRLRALNPRFEGATFRKMLQAKMTFAEALADSSPFDLISRLWLDGVWSAIRPQIAAVA